VTTAKVINYISINERRLTMMFIIHLKEIMIGFDCDFNTAMQLYKRGTTWED